MLFLTTAMKKTNSTDSGKLAEALRGMKLKTPFGADGTITMRAEDQTAIGYALGWGTTVPKEPYVVDIQAGDWAAILEHEAEWKKKLGYV
jgi:branched-chain amino acid transport system substrate-binding protein